MQAPHDNQTNTSLPLVPLGQVRNHLGTKIFVHATVIDIDQDALLVPRHVIARCDPADTPTCRSCPVAGQGGKLSRTIDRDDPDRLAEANEANMGDFSNLKDGFL
jgi:hypothetical protein